MRRLFRITAVAVTVIVVCCAPAFGGWGYTNLHNGSWGSSFGFALTGPSQQGGCYKLDPFGTAKAVLWAGAPSPYTTLGATDAGVYDIYGSDKCGVKNKRAAVWEGTSNAWTDIHPEEVTGGSWAESIWDDKCAGQAGSHAYWWGEESGWLGTDVNPSGYSYSQIDDIQGNSGVGEAMFTQTAFTHAYKWNVLNSAQNVDLHPASAEESYGQAQWEGVQGGRVRWNTTEYTGRAAIWYGSAASCQSMNPTGATRSAINDMTSQNVCGGEVENHAALWLSYSANDYVDLHIPGYYSSAIQAVTIVNEKIYAVGYATLPESIYSHAMLWEFTVPEPGTLAALIGGLAGFAGFALRRRK